MLLAQEHEVDSNQHLVHTTQCVKTNPTLWEKNILQGGNFDVNCTKNVRFLEKRQHPVLS